MAFVEYREIYDPEKVKLEPYITGAWVNRNEQREVVALLFERERNTLHIAFFSPARGARFIHVSPANEKTHDIRVEGYLPTFDENGEFRGKVPTKNISVLREFELNQDLPERVRDLYRIAQDAPEME